MRTIFEGDEMNFRREGREHFWSLNTKSTVTTWLVLYLVISAVPVKADWKSDANARIESIRKRNAQITVVDSNSDPIPSVSVQIQQTKHRFGFGTCLSYGLLYNNTNVQNFVRDHFEWAVCENEMKWASNESTNNVWTFSQADYIANWCASNGIILRGHNLVWETGSQTPSWVSGLSCSTYPPTSEMMDEIDDRIDTTVGRYAGQIVEWDVDNEMLSGNMFDCLGEAGRAHFFQEAYSIDPNCRFCMNEYSGNSFGGYDGGPYKTRAQGLIALGAPIEALGIQGHVSTPFNPALYYSNVLNVLDDLGLPIIATEFDTDATTPSAVADDLENFYRICFSHPNMEGVIMWGFEQNAWRWDGIVNSSTWTLNEAGVRYEALLNEWTTSDSNTTNGSGDVYFRGFHGTYEITLSVPGQDPEVYTIELEPGTTTEQFVIQSNLSQPEPDSNAPQPDPMTWAGGGQPAATGSSTITMTATTATDNTPPVQYYFECTNDASKSSSWQTSTTYTAQGLTPLTQYTFRVRARDSYTTPNYTGWSDPASATTLAPPTNVEIIGSWATGTTHAKESGYNRALIFIAHEESVSGAPTLTSVTYGGQTMDKVIEVTAASGYGNYVAAFILDENDVNLATSGTFDLTWSASTSSVSYASVFLQNVDQATPVGPNDSAGTTSSTPNPITTDPLSANDGDMVILGATCGNNGSYTLNNGFTEGTDQSVGTNGHTGVTGYKSATGAAETPSATYVSGPNRQVIIGFVVRAAQAVDEPPAAPTGLAATAGNGLVELDWNDNNEVDLGGYNVYRSTTQGSGYAKINGTLVADSNYVDNDVNNGTPYYYVVTAVDANANESPYSNEASATPDYQDCNDVKAGGHGLVSDLNGDCYVNLLDVEIISQYWLHTDCSGFGNCEKADMEPDGDVDFADFRDFAVGWLQCNDPQDAGCTPNW
jgi:GH35 family endo-1,4-beta-xylanase